MPPDALSDVTRITVPFGGALTSVSVSGGVQSNQIAAVGAGMTFQMLAFLTEGPIYTRLVLTRLNTKLAQPGSAASTAEDVDLIQVYRLTDVAYTTVFDDDNAMMSSATVGAALEEYKKNVTGTRRRLLEELHAPSAELRDAMGVAGNGSRNLLFWGVVQQVFTPAPPATPSCDWLCEKRKQLEEATRREAEKVVEVVKKVEKVVKVVQTVAQAFGLEFNCIGDAVGYVLGQKMAGVSPSAYIGQMEQQVLGFIGTAFDKLNTFVDWLPFDIYNIPGEIENFLRGVGSDFMSTMEGFLKGLQKDLAPWLSLEGDRFCMGESLAAGMPDLKYEFEKDGQTALSELKMPAKENCMGVVWNEIKINYDRVSACFKTILDDNPVGEFVKEVLSEMLKVMPDAYVKMLDDIENQFLELMKDIFGDQARNYFKQVLDNVDIKADDIRNAGKRRALLDAMDQLPNEGTPQHIRKLLLHPTATPHERSTFEEILYNVTHRRINATMHKLYGGKSKTHENSEKVSSDTQRRDLLAFSKQDLRNLAWFESIPIQFSLGAEFVLSRTFDFLVDSSGDVMKEIGVPVISYEGEIPVATAVAVKVGIRLMMKAPYEFAMVAMRSGLEFRFKTNFDMRIDIATGEIMSTFDTSKDGVTGVRMLGNKLAGHAYAGFQVELGVDVGVCIATFCFDISLNYTQDVLGMGFDFIMDPGKTETFEDSSSVRRFLLQESPDAATNGMDITGLLEKVPEGSELAKTIKAMDKSGDGYLSVDEFETGMKDVIVQTTTSAAGETTAPTAAGETTATTAAGETTATTAAGETTATTAAGETTTTTAAETTTTTTTTSTTTTTWPVWGPEDYDAVTSALDQQLQPMNGFIRYQNHLIRDAADCVLNATREYFIGGAYIVSRWPRVKIILRTPAEQVLGETKIPMTTITLLDWNHREYKPNYLYTDFVPNAIVEGITDYMNTLYAGKRDEALDFIGYGNNQTVRSIINQIAQPRLDDASDATRFAAELIRDGVPKMDVSGLPYNIFEFHVPLFCSSDFFPVEELWWKYPVYVPPLLTMAFDSLTSRRRELLGADEDVTVEEINKARRRRLQRNTTCASHSGPCSTSSQCCGDNVCGYPEYSIWPVCVREEEVQGEVVL